MNSDYYKAGSTAVSTTRSRINEYLIEINADPNSVQRPTEAQLRWAQFQRAERVRETKARIERLMHYPESVSDVPHAFPSDGETTVDDDVDENEVDSLEETKSPCMDQASSNKNAYLGIRQDGQGKWVRRHFSQRRFPHLAKSVPSSSPRHLRATDGQPREYEQSTTNRTHTKNDKKKKKVDISRGRRALLRVSARALEERKRQLSAQPNRITISPVPFSEEPTFLEMNSEDDPNPTVATKVKSKRRKKKKHKVVFENASDLDSFSRMPLVKKISTLTLEDEISGLFTGESSRIFSSLGGTHSRSLRRRRPGSSLTSYISNEEEERIRRFEEAYRAIMLASDAYQQDGDEATVSSEWINSGGKRWTRDPNVTSAVSIDGRIYDDLQRTPTVSMKQMKGSPGCYDSKNGIFREPLHDRAATWMVHVPRPTKSAKRDTSGQNSVALSPSRGRGKERETKPSSRNELLSPCQKKLNDIEQTIQKSVSRTNFDLSQNRRAIAQSPLRQTRSRPITERVDSNFGHKNRPTSRTERGSNALGFEVKGASDATKPKTIINSIRGRSIPSEEPPQSRPSDKEKPRTESPEGSLVNKNTESTTIDSTPTVRASTLRLLFSGISEAPVKVSSNKNPPKKKYSSKTEYSTVSPQDKTKVAGIRETSESCQKSIDPKPRPDTIVSLFGSCGAEYSPNHVESTLAQDHSANESDHRLSPPSLTDANGEDDTFPAEDTVISRNTFHPIDPEHDSTAQQSILSHEDDSRQQNSSSMSVILQRLDVADLVRKSLSQRTDRSIIDTDGTETDITGDFDEENYVAKIGSLLMSPALITKRYQQALQAIEQRNWDQVFYLINADPWLLEMKDVRNDQFLVHVLALFGAGQHDEDATTAQPAPRELIQGMIEHDPSVAHKLDHEGNLPLHMAAASGNIIMIQELGSRFPGAASVQNHDGLLPLHLAIMSCALFPTGEQAVELILSLFREGVSVRDNDGNTPLHTAAGTLKGDVGVDVIYQLMTVCHDLAHSDPVYLRESMAANVKKPKEFDDTATMVTTTTDPFTDASGVEGSFPGAVFCVAKNYNGDTPLARAIKSLAGWQVVEALLSMNGGHLAVLEKNSAYQNALHLVLERDFNDPTVVLAILKAVPSAAPVVDGSGILPIQLACMNCLQREIILAIAIIDLPIDLGARQEAILRNGFGASWWFLVCESDDRYVDIVTEILSMCTHSQKTALCLTKATHNGINKSAIACATSRCKMALMNSLRFLGRFEFTGGQKKHDSPPDSTQQFIAIDYGTNELPIDGGRKVGLRCYMNDIDYIRETQKLHQVNLHEHFFEKLDFFSATELEPNAPHDIRVKHCVAISIPRMSLARVVAGMPKDHKYRRDAHALGRYYGKVKYVLLQTAKALSQLHESGIVHGLVDSHHIGKFGDEWKVTGLLGSIANGSKFPSQRVGLHLPPEAFTSSNDSLIAVPALDVWGFGKLMYEVFVGESLFTTFVEEGDSSIIITTWNERHVATIADELFDARIGTIGISLITSCLRTRREDRLSSMTHVLQNSFWHDANAFSIH
ncbi:hypothetical protein HJC23_007183 [Cyclotella cryptica]|uniref:Protein kinase domain-containing protein n=1 Tax=Cyclotella cryptica TaxID=29204 RepID=A0ABD3QPW7_9STRA|eukprot:CCRYP_003460-RA/>CCRYP_003460-RA protein AED:0.00 eAED:0.00 QI:141/-1/1/1/-1/1/1/278/1547